MATMMSTMMTTMMTGLLLLMLAGVTVSRVVDLDKRVYHGVPCNPKHRLYHVRLRTFVAAQHTSDSGGSLISEQWILTAGHNVEPGETVKATLGFQPVSGKNVKEVTIIEEPIRYIDPSGGGPHDLMLLKLPDAKHGYPIAPRTDCSKAPKITDTVEIAGIGATGLGAAGLKGGPLKTTLHCGDTTVVQCGAICNTAVPFYNKNEKLICYQKPNVDTSKGDSGGGVVFKGMIYGVHIRSAMTACTSPASAINICDLKYKTWINAVTGLKIL